jgi:hypothetical protein
MNAIANSGPKNPHTPVASIFISMLENVRKFIICGAYQYYVSIRKQRKISLYREARKAVKIVCKKFGNEHREKSAKLVLR